MLRDASTGGCPNTLNTSRMTKNQRNALLNIEARRIERRVATEKYVEDRTAIVAAVNELGTHANDYLTLFGRVKTAFNSANIPYDDCIVVVEQGQPACKMIDDVNELVISD